MTPYWKECRRRPFNVTAANCCLWWCYKMAVEGYNCPTLLRGTTFCFKGSDTKTEVRAWTGCILLFSLSCSLSLSLSPPLCWGTARNNHRLTETWRIRSFFSSLSHSLLSARKACRQRERAWQNRSTFSFHHCSLPVGWKPVLSPAYFSLLQSELQWSELTWLLEWQQWGRKWWYNRLSVLKLSESLE